MGLFNRNPKIGIEEFCREFYDTQIFHPIIAGTDLSSVWWDTVFNSIVEADQSFAVVDKSVFQREMTAIRLELFALAWMHKFKRDKYTIPQSIFTQHYLEENGKLGIWDAMQRYNLAVAQTATMTATGEQAEAWRVAQVNEARVDMFDKWAEANIGDPSAPTEKEKMLVNCVAWVGNRIGADLTKNNEIGNRRITALLLYRVGWKEDEDLSEEALFKLAAVIYGLYEGAQEAIKSVNLQP